MLTTTRTTKELSEREREVAALCAKALNAKEIGLLLGLSANTVRVHKSNIYRKLGISNSVELVNYLHEQAAR